MIRRAQSDMSFHRDGHQSAYINGVVGRADNLSWQVLDFLTDAYVGMDSSGRVLQWNRAASSMFGWSHQEAIGQLLTELVHFCEEHSDCALRDMQTVQSLVGSVSPHTLRRRDGTDLAVEVFITAVDSGPQPTFHVLIRDLIEIHTVRRSIGATFKAVFDNAPIGIAVVGLDGSFQRVNQALCQITGYQEHELTQLTFQDITYPDDLDTDLHEAGRLLQGDITSYQMDKRYYAKDGHLIWVHLSASMAHDAEGQPLNFIAHIEDISARKRDEQLLRRQATHDTLTDVFNRGRFEEELALYAALSGSEGYDGEAAVLMIDLDGLKRINDQHGHAAGDDYIKSVAHTIRRRLSLSDVFARIGGDEFAALLPHTTSNQAHKLARTLVDEVRVHSRGSVSIGVSMIRPGQSGGDALQRADQVMYRAKQQGAGHKCES